MAESKGHNSWSFPSPSLHNVRGHWSSRPLTVSQLLQYTVLYVTNASQHRLRRGALPSTNEFPDLPDDLEIFQTYLELFQIHLEKFQIPVENVPEIFQMNLEIFQTDLEFFQMDLEKFQMD